MQDVATEIVEAGVTVPERMRAVRQHRYRGPEALQLETIDVPSIGSSQVLVEVRAAGVDKGTLLMAIGEPWMIRPVFGFRGRRSPWVGLDVAGVVAAVGEGVTRFRVGDRVMGVAPGSFAEYAVAEEHKLSHIPDGLDDAEAAVLAISGITALQALVDHGGVEAGHRVLVTGATGGVGHYAVQIAVALGADVVAVGGAGSGDFLCSLGASVALDYTSSADDPGDHGPYDVVIDVAGNTPTARLRGWMRRGGALVMVGGSGSRATGGFERSVAAKVGSPFVGVRQTFFVAAEDHEHLDRLADLVAGGAVRPVVAERFPLERAADALARLAAGGVRGKLAIVV